MKKMVAAFLFVLAIFCVSPVQAQSDFDLNRDFNEKLVPVSYIYGGRVVGIRTYLSVRARPSVNSREVMRISNGARLSLRYFGDQDWWQVLSIDGNDYGYGVDGIGYVSARYIQID